MAKKIFKESQSYSGTNSLLIAGGFGLILIWIAIRTIIDPAFTIHAPELVAVVLAITAIAAGFWLFLRLEMKTAITSRGIEYRMRPFHSNKNVIRWNEIRKIRVIGIPRLASWQPGYTNYLLTRKFTFSGRNGISIETLDGQIIFIGSHKVKELKKAIRKAHDKHGLFEYA